MVLVPNMECQIKVGFKDNWIQIYLNLSIDMFSDPYGNMPGNRMHNYKNTCSKEANLMPVPSPQQIQFPLLDGQELTIQKQPNTSLRDSDLVSPS